MSDKALRNVLFIRQSVSEVNVSFKWPVDSHISAVYLVEVVNGKDNPYPLVARKRQPDDGDESIYIGPVTIGLGKISYKLIPAQGDKLLLEHAEPSEEYQPNARIGATIDEEYIKLTPRNLVKGLFSKKYYLAEIVVPKEIRNAGLPKAYIIDGIKYPFEPSLDDYTIIVDKPNSISVII